MAKTKEAYLVQGNTGLEPQLNFILQRLADRLDKIEGIRGDAKIESPLSVGPVTVNDADDTTIHSME